MPESFIHQIAQHSGLSPSEAEELLDVFVRHLEEELERSGAAVIPGVGTFSRDNGSTEFEPDSELALAVNFRNAGLDPIPAAVHGLPEHEEEHLEADERVDFEPVQDADTSLETTPVEESEIREAEEDFDQPHEIYAEPEELEAAPTADEESRKAEDSAEPMPGSELDVAEEMTPLTAAAGDEEVSSLADEAEETAVEELQPAAEISPVEEEGPAEPLVTEAPPPSPVQATEPAMVDETATRSDRPPEEPPRRKSATPWLIAAVAILFLAIVGVMVLFTTGDSDPRPGDEAIVEAPPPPIADEDVDGSAAIEDDDVDDPAVAEPEPEPAAPFDPLRGDNIDRSQSRYTLVVASLPSDGAAEVVMNQWRNRGFRTAVFSETIDGVTRHRVGVGQFNTIDQADAVRARTDLEFPLPEGTWVYRYPAGTSN